MKKFSLCASVVLGALMFAPSPAHSQTVCPRGYYTSEAAFTLLQDRYQEVNEAFLVAGSGDVFFVFVNPSSKTWTVLKVRPDGCASVVAAGTGYEFALGEREGEPS